MKWFLPFIPMLNFAFPPPDDMTTRVIRVVGVLIAVAILLGIIQPWKADDGSDNKATLRIRGGQ